MLTIKTHLTTGVLPEASPIIILEDMSGPSGILALHTKTKLKIFAHLIITSKRSI